MIATNSAGASFELRERPCPTCGPGETRLVGLRGGRHHRYGLGVETRIVECARCSLRYPNPFPYPTAPSELYGDPDKYFADTAGAEKVRESRTRVRKIVALTGKRDPSVLDVGCGMGEFLQGARLEGLTNAVGLELSDQIADRAAASGVTVHRQTIEEFASSAELRFDAIMLTAVIEHVHDPDAMIAAASRLAKPGAVMYIDAPNEPHLVSRVGNAVNRLRGNEAVYDLAPTWPPYHVFGFNPRALHALLAKHGFQIEELHVRGSARIPGRGLRALAANGIGRIANVVGMGSNMDGWARRT